MSLGVGDGVAGAQHHGGFRGGHGRRGQQGACREGGDGDGQVGGVGGAKAHMEERVLSVERGRRVRSTVSQ